MNAPSIQLLRALRSAAFKQPGPQSHQVTPKLLYNSHPKLRTSTRHLSSTRCSHAAPRPALRHSTRTPSSHDRGPPSKEDTQTDFGALDILGNIGTPATAVDACTTDGFHLNNGLKTTDGSGVMLLGGEAWAWRPWEAPSSSSGGGSAVVSREGLISDLLSPLGTLEIAAEGAWGVLRLLYPKPDLLILGTGRGVWPISKATREYLQGELGLRVDIMDTGNAAAAYNLLATERGVEGVGAAMLPVGWKGNGR